MNTPSPINPLSPLAQPGKGKPNVRLFVVSIILLHAVFFGGLLLQGCKKPSDGGSFAGTGTSVGGLTNDLTPILNTNPPPYGMDSGQSGLAGQPFGQPLYPTAPTNPPLVTPITPPVEPLLPAAPTGTTEYAVKAGDTPAKIAKSHGVSLNALMQANPGLEPRRLKIGQMIQIPATASQSGGGSAGTVGSGAEPATLYLVKSGDTLTKIAKARGLTVKELRAANSLRTDRINVGQKLKVPAGKSSPPPAAGSAATSTTTVTPALPPASLPGETGTGGGELR